MMLHRLIATLVTTFLLLGSCGQSDLENELAASRGETEQERQARIAAETRASQTAARAEAAEARVKELEAQGTPVVSLALFITVRCTATSGGTNQSVRGIVTAAQLQTRGGDSWRFATSSTQTPSIAEAGGGAYDVTFRFHPARTASVLGRDIDDLREVQFLETATGSVLSSMGFDVSSAGITNLRVVVNNIKVIDVSDLGMPEPGKFARLDVSEHFARVSEAYRSARQPAEPATPL